MLSFTLLFHVFSKKFVYNVLKSVKDVDERPLYDKIPLYTNKIKWMD